VLSCHQAGVDGSLRELPDGTVSAAGSAVYYTTVRGANELVAHIVTCTFDGDQTVANAECSACTLALQTLSHVDNVEIG
jgi:ribonuclease HI